MVNEKSLDFGLFVRQQIQFEDFSLGSWILLSLQFLAILKTKTVVFFFFFFFFFFCIFVGR